MSVIHWDETGVRRFETGVDRGVLYLPGNRVYPWNGLTAVSDKSVHTLQPYYMDGVKYLEQQVVGAYSGTLQAYTYPDELNEVTGHPVYYEGVFLHEQHVTPLSLSYRTRVGNDLAGLEHGYKLHLLFNVLAVPSDTTHSSTSNTPAAEVFEWSLSGMPMMRAGIHPTSHVSLESRTMNPVLLQQIENILYGTEETNPYMPDLVTLMTLVNNFYTP